MQQSAVLRGLVITLGPLILSACASNSKNTPLQSSELQTSEIQNTAQYETSHVNAVPVTDLPSDESEPLPFEDSQPQQGQAGFMPSVAQGSANTARGLAAMTADGVGMVAKGTLTGAKFGGKAALGAGGLIVRGTQRTANGVKNGVGAVMSAPAVKDAASPVGHKTLTDAALSPLSDFNLRKRKRPEILMRLDQEDPYQLQDNASCEWLEVRVAELDEILGEDYDVEKEKASNLEKAGKAGKSVTISGVVSAAGAFIPGRGIIRTLSGAKSRQKKTREIYQKGVARRSFLKGIAQSQDCPI